MFTLLFLCEEEQISSLSKKSRKSLVCWLLRMQSHEAGPTALWYNLNNPKRHTKQTKHLDLTFLAATSSNCLVHIFHLFSPSKVLKIRFKNIFFFPVYIIWSFFKKVLGIAELAIKCRQVFALCQVFFFCFEMSFLYGCRPSGAVLLQ